MALIKADRVKETTATVGTGAFTLAGAVSTYRTFASVMAVNDTCYYTAINAATGEWETGRGCLTASNTLARGRIYAGTNGVNATNFGAGLKEVFMSAQASQICAEDSFNQNTYTGFADENLSFCDPNISNNRTFSNVTTGFRNICIGNSTGGNFSSASLNLAIGHSAMVLNEEAFGNTVVGYDSLGWAGRQSVNAGSECSSNVCVGLQVARTNATVTLKNSVLIGALSDTSGSSEVNCIVIGHNARSNGSNTTTLGNTNTTDCHIHGNIVPTKAFKPASLADSVAPNNAIYYSTTASKLVYKDSGGTVNNLY